MLVVGPSPFALVFCFVLLYLLLNSLFPFLLPGSDTPLAKMVTSPQLVRDIDWVDWCWPEDRKGEKQFPKVGIAVRLFSSKAQEDSTARKDLSTCGAVAVISDRDIDS